MGSVLVLVLCSRFVSQFGWVRLKVILLNTCRTGTETKRSVLSHIQKDKVYVVFRRPQIYMILLFERGTHPVPPSLPHSPSTLTSLFNRNETTSIRLSRKDFPCLYGSVSSFLVSLLDRLLDLCPTFFPSVCSLLLFLVSQTFGLNSFVNL